jgi:hypothetical protein
MSFRIYDIGTDFISVPDNNIIFGVDGSYTTIPYGIVISSSTGTQGPQGPQGFTGTQGPQGFTGTQGPQGFTGPQGPIGYSGPLGPQGLQGFTGPQGKEGPPGFVGPQGPQGFTGPQGPIGYSGPLGPQGPQGFTGPDGPQGFTGPDGPQGFTGPQGPQGFTGPDGPQGFTGPDGPQGFTGPDGPQGFTGPDGPQGFTGPDGPQGFTGPDGPQGFTGPDGPQGFTGPDGPQGFTGPDGPQGFTGPDGPQGFTGPDGPQGFTGPDGPQGFTGPQGIVGPQGFTGPQGIVGPQGFTGPQGIVGPQGFTGPQGPVGTNIFDTNFGTVWHIGNTGIQLSSGTNNYEICCSSDSTYISIVCTTQPVTTNVLFISTNNGTLFSPSIPQFQSQPSPVTYFTEYDIDYSGNIQVACFKNTSNLATAPYYNTSSIFQQLSGGQTSWSSIVISGDSNYIIACSNANLAEVFKKVNGTYILQPYQYSVIGALADISYNGQYQVVIPAAGNTSYISNGYGATGTIIQYSFGGNPTSLPETPLSVVMTSDGTNIYMITVTAYLPTVNKLYNWNTTTLSWTQFNPSIQNNPITNMNTISISANGKYQAMIYGSNNNVAVSSDNGITWSSIYNLLPSYTWTDITVSPDASQINLVSNNGYVYISKNSISSQQGDIGPQGPQGIQGAPGQGLLSVNGTISSNQILNLSNDPVILIQSTQNYSIIVDSFLFYSSLNGAAYSGGSMILLKTGNVTQASIGQNLLQGSNYYYGTACVGNVSGNINTPDPNNFGVNLSFIQNNNLVLTVNSDFYAGTNSLEYTIYYKLIQTS